MLEVIIIIIIKQEGEGCWNLAPYGKSAPTYLVVGIMLN